MFTFNEITLRKIEKDDIALLFRLKQESWEFTHHVSILNKEDQEKWFDSLDSHPHSPRELILIATISVGHHGQYLPTKIGVIKLSSIDWVNRTTEIGWDLFKEYRGKGHGKSLVKSAVNFCFSVLNLHRLNCEILEDNLASQACAKHSGFVQEGIKREAVFHAQYKDSYVFGLLYKDHVRNQYEASLKSDFVV